MYWSLVLVLSTGHETVVEGSECLCSTKHETPKSFEYWLKLNISSVYFLFYELCTYILLIYFLKL